MDKVIVEVYIPIISKSYDMFIPMNSPMYEVVELVGNAVKGLSDGRFIPTATTALCNKESGEIYDVNKTVYDLGISNGSKLLLI